MKIMGLISSLALNFARIQHALLRVSAYGWKTTLAKLMYRLTYSSRYPRSICVESMTVCNLKCSHCRTTLYPAVDPNMAIGFMELAQFNRMVDRLAPLIKRAENFGFSTNEPLFHKDILAMIDRVISINNRIEISLLSNGLLLTEKRVDELLSRKNIISISVSLDGVNKETVEKFKTGVRFDKVVNNIRTLRKKAPNMVINVVFVATRDNYDALESYVDFCADLGVDAIFVNGFQSFTKEQASLYLYSPDGNDLAMEMFRRAARKAKEHRIGIVFPKLIPEEVGCERHSIMYVKDDGDVSPCVVLGYPTNLEFLGKFGSAKSVVFGNVFDEDPYQLWNKPEYVHFRSKLATPEKFGIPIECASCADAYGLVCSGRAPVVLL